MSLSIPVAFFLVPQPHIFCLWIFPSTSLSRSRLTSSCVFSDWRAPSNNRTCSSPFSDWLPGWQAPLLPFSCVGLLPPPVADSFLFFSSLVDLYDNLWPCSSDCGLIDLLYIWGGKYPMVNPQPFTRTPLLTICFHTELSLLIVS